MGAFFTAIFFSLTLSFLWRSGFSDNKILGGFLPYKDAYYYYQGARLILDGIALPEFSVQAAGRPLFPGFLASLLFLTGRNLQLSIILLALLLGATMYLSAHLLSRSLGVFPATLYAAFSFLYLHPQIGFLHTEVLGLILGNLALILLWQVLQEKKKILFFFGILVLMVAVSARAGAFFVFPMLALWAGYFWRGDRAFSWEIFASALAAIVVMFLVVNSLYARLVVEPGNRNFGNFAYTLYGQIHGGTGWNRAIRDMGTRDPEIIMDAALKTLRKSPVSLLIGSAKAYRDFFLPQERGVFNFHTYGAKWVNLLFWSGSLLLLLVALYKAILQWKSPHYGLLLAIFIGTFLSIPFLPPIDGGNRFYASTMPLFFAFLSLAVAGQDELPALDSVEKIFHTVQQSSLILIVLVLVFPLVLFYTAPPVELEFPTCSSEEFPYGVRIDPHFSVQLSSSSVNPDCGTEAQNLCLEDFVANGSRADLDLPFFDEVITQVQAGEGITSVFTANNLVKNGRFHYFFLPADLLASIPPGKTITGCAIRLRIEEMSSKPVLYLIESVEIP